MTKKKPNYTQFMRKPAPLEMSPPSNTDDPHPRGSGPLRREIISEEKIPWGEVIVEFGPNDSVPLGLTQKGSEPGRRPVAPPPALPARPTDQRLHAPMDHADIEGIAVFPEPAPAEAPLRASEMVEWAFPGPGAPPLVFMAIAIVLLLCLL